MAGMMPKVSSTAQALLYGSFLLTLLGLIAAFTGNLTATLAVQKRVWPFKTLREFADSDYNLYIAEGTLVEEALKVEYVNI